MGCCFSSSSSSSSTTTTTASSPTAIIITVDGSLIEHSIPVTASKVLGIDHFTCFLCCSDSLCFDTPIPQLPSHCYLEPDQIYFILPKSKLGYTLTGPYMATLAVKASSALKQLGSEKGGQDAASAAAVSAFAGTKGETAMVMQRSVREKLGRNASAWAKAMQRSFRRTLSKIVEEVDDDQ